MKPVLNREKVREDFADDFEPGVRRSAQEVAKRCIVLSCVVASLEFSAGYFNDWLKQEGLWEELSPNELELLTAEVPTRRQRVAATWRAESLQVLLWSLGCVSEMCPMTKQVHSRNLLAKLPEPDSETREFVDSAVLRPDAEIDQEMERVVYAHWQLNEQSDADQKAEPMIPGVVTERHAALEWIVNANDEPWDEVGTNT